MTLFSICLMTETKDMYKKLAKKYDLPDYDKLNSQFEIGSIESNEFLLRDIRKKIGEKMGIYSRNLDSILHPEATLTDLYESKFFTDEEKNKIFQIYKKLMILNRTSLVVSTVLQDTEEVKFINKASNEWDSFLKEFKKIFEKLKDLWKVDTDIKEHLEYFG